MHLVNYGKGGSPTLLAARPRLAPAVNWACFLGSSAGAVWALCVGLAPALLPLLGFSAGASCTRNIKSDDQAHGMAANSAGREGTHELFMHFAVANLRSTAAQIELLQRLPEAASALSA